MTHTKQMPKVSKNAQTTTLSAKKSKKKETIKNVLATPFAKHWPIITDEESSILKVLLLQHLPSLIPEQLKIPWTELRKVPKGERKAFKENYRIAHLSEGETLPPKAKRDGIILGINDITKSLEHQTAIAVLISKDVRPKVMVEHLVHQSILLKIPVLIVDGLRDTIKQKTGISSVAIAFVENKQYEPIHCQINDIAKLYPVQNSHINFERSKEILQKVESITILDDSEVSPKKTIEPEKVDCITILDDTTPKEKVEQIMECITILDDSSISEQETVQATPNEKIEQNEIDFTHIYLRKTDPKKREFVPGENSFMALEKSSGFVSFSTDTSSMADRFLRNYVPLKVKNVKADINRNKKKIEKAKRKLLNHHINKNHPRYKWKESQKKLEETTLGKDLPACIRRALIWLLPGVR